MPYIGPSVLSKNKTVRKKIGDITYHLKELPKGHHSSFFSPIVGGAGYMAYILGQYRSQMGGYKLDKEISSAYYIESV